MTIDEQLAYLTKGAEETIRAEELRAKLEESAKTGKKLRVYLGVDPTAPDIHLGHTVVLRKLKHFQELGHTAIFLIGDFSAMIGDPTGQSETRPPLAREDVEANARTYLAQVYKILDRDKTEVRYNSEWLGKMASYDVVRLCGHYRLARMLEREDFRSRLDKNLPISVHELLYPLLTAYDAVMLKSDVELGATEQKFNLLVHRDIQREYGLTPQVILTMPILEGLDGVKKMSKSLGNYIGISEAPAEMFGKVMSISDELMWRYYLLLTDMNQFVIQQKMIGSVAMGGLHPMQAKMDLAHEIVTQFHGRGSADAARQHFESTIRHGMLDSAVPLQTAHVAPDHRERLDERLVKLGLCPSKSDAQRHIKAGSVKISWASAPVRWKRLSGDQVGRPPLRPRKNPVGHGVAPPTANWIMMSDPTYAYEPRNAVGGLESPEVELWLKVGRKQARVRFIFDV
jgi:tyrosyl-tRNA synthetase